MLNTTKNDKDKDLPKNFYWRVYLKLNPDLKQDGTKDEATTHFLKYGMKEKRSYFIDIPNDFNWRGYIYLNKDLQKTIVTKRESIKHYMLNGYFEKRIYSISLPDDFSWEEYIVCNPDLKDEIQNEKTAIEHYLKNGFFENRSYSKTIIITENLNNHEDYYISENMDNDYNDCQTDLYHDELHEHNILRTITIKEDVNSSFLKYLVNEDIIYKINSFVLVIDFFNGGGGTTFFLNTIISKYKNLQTFVILRNINGKLHVNVNEEYKITKEYDLHESIHFLENIKSRICKVFVNHMWGHETLFLEKVFSLNTEIIGITHDYYNLTKKMQPFCHEIENVCENNPSIIEINNYDHIITQNVENLRIFRKYYKNKISLSPLPDYLLSDKTPSYYNYADESHENRKIVLGIIGNMIQIKGKKILEKIIQYYKNSKYVEVVVIGMANIKNFHNYHPYDSIEELNNIVYDKKVSALLELSLWPETYSYTLTLAMTMDLPIFYLEKKFYSVVKNRLSKYLKSYSFTTIKELNALTKKYKQNYFYKIFPILFYSKFWNDIFVTKKEKMVMPIKNFKHGVQPYFIYFPQFHDIIENNVFFYEGYNDIKNLEKYNNDNIVKTNELDTSYLNIQSLKDYDLTNADILQKQIDLVDTYGFKGFAMYYYWFSVNNITEEQMIMEHVVNRFFDTIIDMKDKKIFFIWANENWTNNAAFGGNARYKIENIYDTTHFIKNAENLIKYFKHKNYLKIENKPVFFIYHNFLIENIDNFYNILNAVCLDNGFDGVYLVLNSFLKKNQKYKQFYINFNYKTNSEIRFYDSAENQIKLDYQKYIFNENNINKKTIQTVVFDFNNRPRLFMPNKLELSTVCINSAEINKILFCDKLLATYQYEKESEIDNILLVNAFNEWGENMAFEPSKKYGFYNLNLLYEYLSE